MWAAFSDSINWPDHEFASKQTLYGPITGVASDTGIWRSKSPDLVAQLIKEATPVPEWAKGHRQSNIALKKQVQSNYSKAVKNKSSTAWKALVNVWEGSVAEVESGSSRGPFSFPKSTRCTEVVILIALCCVLEWIKATKLETATMQLAVKSTVHTCVRRQLI